MGHRNKVLPGPINEGDLSRIREAVCILLKNL